MNKYRLGVGIALTLVLWLGVPASAQEVIAVYGEAAQAKGACPPNWQFLWNARGAIGDARAYEPVPFDAGARK